jgi:hypothetical protein
MKYLLIRDNKSYYITRFNHRQLLQRIYTMTDIESGNCHFYEFHLDFPEL